MVPDAKDWVSPSRAVFAFVGGLVGLLVGVILGYRRERAGQTA